MMGLLQEALRRVESLSQEEQDAIASQIVETLDDEDAWARRFRGQVGTLAIHGPRGSGGAPPW
jgi:hypothetical protein